jgi:hypothetical protein
MNLLPRPRLWPACLFGSAALAFAGCQSEDMRPTAYRNMQPGQYVYYGNQYNYPGAYGYASPYAYRAPAAAPAAVAQAALPAAPSATGSPFPSRDLTPAALNNLQAQVASAGQVPPLTARTAPPAQPTPVIEQVADHTPIARPTPAVEQVQFKAPAEPVRQERPAPRIEQDHPRAVVEGFHSVAMPLPKGPERETPAPATSVSLPAAKAAPTAAAPAAVAPAAPAPAAVPFTHAKDYTWIAGEMQQWRKTWRLRYTALDQTDAYGGSLPVVGDDRLLRFRDGGTYLLQGRVVDDASPDGGPAFLVEAVLVIEP